ncbi:MAG: glycosyltransferase family 4 protein [Phycisphaerae bacterium]|nr:glycosyltransferase family 4 protein [Phycisphaerae bacterium]
MRIAMIGSRGIPAGIGGVERVVEHLTRGLAARGHEVLIYGRRHYVGDRRPDQGRLILTPGLSHPSLDAITHSATASLDALFRRVDVVHVHSPGPAVWSWLPALRRPVVFTVHAPDWRREKWPPLARSAIRAGLTIGSRVARAITAVSPSLAAELETRLHRPVACIPNAAPNVTLVPAEKILALGLQPERYALHVGRMVPEKRLHVLLEAWRRANPDWPLVVVSDEDVAAYARRCRAAAPANVKFVGPKFGRELAELYSHAGMVIQPSVLEGASLVVLEAAAYGRCCLLADIPANRDVLGPSAVYTPPDDSAVFAEQIVRYTNNDAQRESLGRSACRHVREHFDGDGVVESYIAMYRKVLSEE